MRPALFAALSLIGVTATLPVLAEEKPASMWSKLFPGAAPAAPAPAAPAASGKSWTPVATTAPAVAAPANLNTAATAELEKLPKIGPARARTIIAGRPYRTVEELITRHIIPADAYEAVKARVAVK